MFYKQNITKMGSVSKQFVILWWIVGVNTENAVDIKKQLLTHYLAMISNHS